MYIVHTHTYICLSVCKERAMSKRIYEVASQCKFSQSKKKRLENQIRNRNLNDRGICGSLYLWAISMYLFYFLRSVFLLDMNLVVQNLFLHSIREKSSQV